MKSRHIHLDPLGGIAGDMFVAAMLDAFPTIKEQVFADVAAVLPAGVGTACLDNVFKNGVAALHFFLQQQGDSDQGSHHGSGEILNVGMMQATTLAPRTYHSLGTEASAYPLATKPPHSHASLTNYLKIKNYIENSGLAAATVMHSLGILEILAQAESHIHGVPIEEVHFHELADWDSLMDIVAAGSALSTLGEATWSISPLPLGSGQIKTQHGLLPVPAPATARILQDYPWRNDLIPGERVTPTGAAIVRYLIPPECLSNQASGVMRSSGYGAGTKNLPGMPNILRLMVFDKADVRSAPDKEESIAVIEFDIDDMSGEEIGVAADKLRAEEGVLDLTLIQAFGKKSRPVTRFHLLTDLAKLDQCCVCIFNETSTIGLRWGTMQRIVLPRRAEYAEGGARIKTVRRPEGIQTKKIESSELEPLHGLENRRQVKAAAEGY